jgi:protein-glutamine gamma-glutamyltransferase
VNTPFLLLGATILFWGWQTGQWLVATACALVLESARFTAQRVELSPERLSRISDFCLVLACVLFGGFYMTLGNPRAITQLFLWLPLAWLPLALAQAYGTQREIELGVLFWSMRRVSRRRPAYVNIGYAYAAAWIIAASAANRRDPLFDVAVVLLAAWALWHARPRSRSLAVWLLLLPLAAAAGYAGHSSLHELQLWIEANATDWLRGDGGSNTDPDRADTDIGHIGRLKQSDTILMRVRTSNVLLQPLLLHRASYATYTGLRWLAKNAPFTPVMPGEIPGTWPLEPEHRGSASRWVAITEHGEQPNGVLSLPEGTQRIEGLNEAEMRRNGFGALRIERRPGLLAYRAFFAPGGCVARAPDEDDLVLPRREAETLQRVAAELQLASMAPSAAMNRLARYFDERFSYSLYQREESIAVTPISDFLLRTRSGHCEYFATATVLLLRAAGIPSRYATGFSVQEWNDFEAAYLVRQRHAHAWARAWIDGAWRDLDTTPASWAELENQSTPWWSRLADLASWLRLQVAQFQSREDLTPAAWTAIGALLSAWLVLRVIGRSTRFTRTARKTHPSKRGPVPGADSEFYRIEQAMAVRFSERAPEETMRDWLRRIRSHILDAGARDELAALLELHYRCRFDPRGVSPAERNQFRERVRAWLTRPPITR